MAERKHRQRHGATTAVAAALLRPVRRLTHWLIGLFRRFAPGPIAHPAERQVGTVARWCRAYINFWLRKSTVTFLLSAAVVLFVIDTAFYYAKLAPYPQSQPISQVLETRVTRASAERQIREGRYSHLDDPNNRTPNCRDEPSVGREAFKIVQAIFEAPTTGGTLSLKEIYDLEFAQWLAKHFIGGSPGAWIDTDGPMVATCADIRIALPEGARLPGDSLSQNLRVELREIVPHPDLGSTVDFLPCRIGGFDDCTSGYARVVDAGILRVGDQCVLRVVVMNWMQEIISPIDVIERQRWDELWGDRVARVTIDYLAPGAETGTDRPTKVVCKDKIPLVTPANTRTAPSADGAR